MKECVMDFDIYQKQSELTAIYPGKGTLIGLLYVGLGLGEAGEMQGKIKKILRDDLTVDDLDTIATEPIAYTSARIDAISGELGDVLWYLAQTATELGLSLSDIAEANLEKLNSRKERGVLKGSGDNR